MVEASGSPAQRGADSREHPQEVTPDLSLGRDPEGTVKEEQAAAGKAVTWEELQGEWTAPAPRFTAAQPEVRRGIRRHAGARCAPSAIPGWCRRHSLCR